MQARRQGYAQLGANVPLVRDFGDDGSGSGQVHDPIAHAVVNAPVPPRARVMGPVVRKKVYLGHCCCCIDLRVGARILLGMDLIASVVSLFALYALAVIFSTVDEIVSDFQATFGWLLDDPSLYFSGTVNIIGIIMAMVGIAGMMRDSLKLVKAYTAWRFFAIVVNNLWPFVYALAGFQRNRARKLCDSFYPDAPDSPSVGLPWETYDECVENFSHSDLGPALPYLAWNLAWSLYFAVSFLSYYHHMHNEHIDREERDIQLHDVELGGNYPQVVPRQPQQAIYVQQPGAAHAGYSGHGQQPEAVQMVQHGLQQAAQQPMAQPSAPSDSNDVSASGRRSIAAGPPPQF